MPQLTDCGFYQQQLNKITANDLLQLAIFE